MIDVIRIALTAILLYASYKETGGIWTTVSLMLIFMYIELKSFVDKKGK